MPRMLNSTSNSLACSSLQATSSARTSWDPGDLACTGRNHPIRSSCAIPRASLRSVLITMADSAAFTCRVSSRTTSNPAATKPACSHCDRGPASNPIRVTPVSSPRKNRTRASGSLATFASRTILPRPSTTHTLLCSNDTSIPAKCSMTVLRDVWSRPTRTPLNTITLEDSRLAADSGGGPLRHLQPGQLLSVQGAVRQRRRAGIAGDQPAQADPEEPHVTGDRRSGRCNGGRAAGLGPGARLGGAEAARVVDLARRCALRVAAPRPDLDEAPPQSARSQGGTGWHPVDRGADHRARESQGRQGSAWRVRERVPGLLRRAGRLLRRHAEGRRADLSADVYRYLRQGGLRQAL